MLLLSRSEFSARYAASGLVWTKYRNVSQSWRGSGAAC